MSEHLPRGLHHEITMMVRRIFHHQVRDQIGMIELIDVAVQRAVEHEVAIAPSVVQNEVRGTLAKSSPVEHARQQGRSGRNARVAAGAYIKRQGSHCTRL